MSPTPVLKVWKAVVPEAKGHIARHLRVADPAAIAPDVRLSRPEAAALGLPERMALGLVEVGLAVWVMSGLTPGLCALAQTVLLVLLNANGLLWARHIIHDPAGMVVKNVPFLLLAWVAAAMSGGRS